MSVTARTNGHTAPAWPSAAVGPGGARGFYSVRAVISVIFVAKATHETKGVETETMER